MAEYVENAMLLALVCESILLVNVRTRVVHPIRSVSWSRSSGLALLGQLHGFLGSILCRNLTQEYRAFDIKVSVSKFQNQSTFYLFFFLYKRN
jgi:hypothetical protein